MKTLEKNTISSDVTTLIINLSPRKKDNLHSRTVTSYTTASVEVKLT